MIQKKFVAAGMLAAAALFTAPAALAEPLPNPEPVPVPVPEQAVGELAPVPVEPQNETRISAPSVSGSQSETTPGYLEPNYMGPNINGTPCEGGFESTLCYAEQMGDSPEAVQPRSELSASP